ncbi:ectonucleoside triphosphate diphosphohydrolase 2-like [Paramacrobiotus metropolitanus]|uniref:ectonucleoside triphosphate diphosphohydrolase 2-like n=1 Tax=Paramacrobiotus metropolitanus TaxID=2943436 RepID=UPI002446443D|nr:ectonucleoside triphosphate diphosphohydrolase 2-like [Paramacrobiotus metropolitanus]
MRSVLLFVFVTTSLPVFLAHPLPEDRLAEELTSTTVISVTTTIKPVAEEAAATEVNSDNETEMLLTTLTTEATDVTSATEEAVATISSASEATMTLTSNTTEVTSATEDGTVTTSTTSEVVVTDTTLRATKAARTKKPRTTKVRTPYRRNTTVAAVKADLEHAEEITSDGTDDIELSMKNLFETPEEHEDYRYVVIIDAGSSHTDLVIYEWHVDKINGSGVVQEKLHKQCTAPLSTFRDTPEAAGPSLRECLQHASLEVPKSQHKMTKVLLGATAGMRVLRENNAALAAEILKSVVSFIRNEFTFNVLEENIQILSPELEGGYSWISINYIKKIFIDNARLPTDSRLVTWGSLDLGGASTQFTSEITPTTTKKIRATFRITLYGHEYKVYTRSYLCYGKNEAYRRYKAILLSHKNFTEPIADPCRPIDYETTVESAQHFGRPCSNGSIPTHHHKERFSVRGSGDAEGCRQLVSELFQKNMDLSPSVCPFADGECTFRGIEKGKVEGKFVGSGALYYDTKNLRVVSNESFSIDPFDFAGFRAARQAVCGKTHSQMERFIERRPELKSFFLRQCFDTTYLEVLLGEVYNLSDEVLGNTTFAKKINGIDVGWTLGWAVAASSDLPNSGYESLYLYNKG